MQTWWKAAVDRHQLVQVAELQIHLCTGQLYQQVLLALRLWIRMIPSKFNQKNKNASEFQLFFLLIVSADWRQKCFTRPMSTFHTS